MFLFKKKSKLDKALPRLQANDATLTELYLSSNNIGDEGAKALSQALTHNTTLTTLYLYDSNIGDEGAKALSQALTHNTTLTILNLSSNNIGVEGAKALAQALTHNTTLKILYLSNNNIGDEGENAILNALEYNISLTELVIDFKSNVTKKKVNEILHGNTTKTRIKKTPPSQSDKQEQVNKKEPPKESNHATKMTANLTMQKYNGSDIESRDELIMIQKHLEKDLEAAVIYANDNIESEEAITRLENIHSRLEPIQQAVSAESQQESHSGLLSLDELKMVGIGLKDELNSELRRLTQERGKIMTAVPLDFSKLKELTSKIKKLKADGEKHIQDADARFVEAENSLKTRRQALEASAGALKIKASLTGYQAALEESRSIIKVALESRSSQQESPKNVSLDYLALLTKDWSKDCERGRGAQGKVYRGYDSRLNRAVAVKLIPKWGNLQRDAYEREIMALSKLNHPNIVRVLARCETNPLFNHLVYEYAAGGTLAEALNSNEARATFKWQRRVGAIVSLVHALQYCYSNKVKHRDVKPENICFQDEDFRQLLLIDFGISTEVEGTMTSFGGTFAYMAPEYKLHRKYFDEPQEVYSVGVVMISLVTGETTSTGLEHTMVDMIQAGNSQEYLSNHADPNAGDWDQDVLDKVSELAHHCICDTPEGRPTFESILEVLAALRSKLTTQLTNNQSVALQQELATSFIGSTPSYDQKHNCGCGGKAVGGVFCRNRHYQCLLCLEGSLKRQMGSEKICCQIGRCEATFEIADLEDKVDRELLAEHALEQSNIRQGRVRDTRINAEVQKLGHNVKDWLKENQLVIAAGIGALASRRSECPTLCVLWPCRSGRLTAKHLYCREYQLYFLCAFDRTPTVSSILVVKRRDWVKKVAPVLKYSIMAFKLMGAVYGVPVPLPDCIPGDALEKLSNLTESLSDIIGIEDYSEWFHGLAGLQQSNLDEESFKKLMYQEAEGLDAEAHAAVVKIANKKGNLAWKDEMDFKANGRREWVWVKKSNVEHWQQEG